MDKGKYLLIAMLCGLDSSQAEVRDILSDPDVVRQMAAGIRVTKDELFAAKIKNSSIFERGETWTNIERIIDYIRQGGEEIEVADFMKPVSFNRSALKMAQECGSLNKLFTPKIWAGHSAEMESLWFTLTSPVRMQHDFRAIRRAVAQAEGRVLREDQLEKMGIRDYEIRSALRDGDLTNVKRKLAEHGERIRKEDVFLLDSNGETVLEMFNTWRNFDRIVDELASHGEKFTADDFLFKRGDAKTPLQRAADHGFLGQVFAPKIWSDRPREMMALYERVPQDRRGKIDINKILSVILEAIYGKAAEIDENVTLAQLIAVLNQREMAEADSAHPFRPLRPLGLKGTWEKMDFVRRILAARGEKVTLSHLRLESGPGGEACLIHSTRAGCFSQIMSMLRESGEYLDAKDLMSKPAGQDKALLDILVENKELPVLFMPENWVGRAQEMLALRGKIPNHACGDLNMGEILGQVNRLTLRERYAAGRAAGPGPAP